MNSKSQMFKNLEFMAQMAPAPFYWMDIKTLKILGANKLCWEAMGARSSEDIIGKGPYDYYPSDIAENLVAHILEVARTKKGLTQEDRIRDISTGKIRYYTAVRAPLFDEDGEVIGVVGISMEITAEKEAERLRLENQRLILENETQKISTQLEEHKKFKQVADQMAHDLGSPLMALSVLTSSCAGIPETQRNMLRESASRIRDIAGNILSQYKPEEEILNTNISKEFLVYAALEQIIIDKQYEYHNFPIKFECEYKNNSVFSFIETDSTSFKRMLSNLINNSVDAIKENPGKITLKLNSNDEYVGISIIDTGMGMPDIIKNKLINNIPVTHGKTNGHGIGFSQIHDTLKQSNGQIFIKSTPGLGTTIELVFPKIPAPQWIAENIILTINDDIVILDDDNSIHGAWDLRFAAILKQHPTINVRHFSMATEVLDYINTLTDAQKNMHILLSDYELIKQSYNGLDVIEQAKIERSILVTSHYTDENIRERSFRVNTKILPKLLASEVKINLKNIIT